MIKLKEKIKNKKAIIGVIGLGYVGLPLALNFCSKGYDVIGFDKDRIKIDKINKRISYMKNIDLNKYKKKIQATLEFKNIKKCDIIIITVPTPLKKNYEPDLSFIEETMVSILPFLRKNQLISLESTSYPGTTEDLIAKRLKKMSLGKDFFICYSPEREDPGNKYFRTKNVPKIISGHTSNCLKIGKLFYQVFFKSLVPVSSTRTAEFTKLLENIYRSVNIGLVNEMKIISKKMNINIHEAVKAAGTKPFGYRPFDPGPGMGGHCIPIDPFYMSWKAKKLGYNPRFIKEAGIINTIMPKWIVSNIEKVLKKNNIRIKNTKILIIGIAYKKNIDDDRESPAYEIMNILKKKVSKIAYHDPLIKKIDKKEKFKNFSNLKSISLTGKNIKKYDVTLIVTDHDNVNYSLILNNSKIIFDCRNKIKVINKKVQTKVVKL